MENFGYCQYKAERGFRADGYNLVENDEVLNHFTEFRSQHT